MTLQPKSESSQKNLHLGADSIPLRTAGKRQSQSAQAASQTIDGLHTPRLPRLGAWV